MKKLRCALAAMLIGITACMCGACSTDEDKNPSATTQNTQTFVSIVAQIPDDVTVDWGAKIDVALLVYDYLNDAEKNNSDVAAAKTRLDGLKTQYAAVKAEADEQAEIAREAKLASDFVDGVNALPAKLKLSDRSTVDELKEKYDGLKDESKQKSEVKAAYEKLLAADTKVEELEEAARQEQIKTDAEEFISAVEEELEIIEEAEPDERDEVILKEGSAIENLVYDYEDFEDEVRAYEGVAEAKEKLDGIYAEYTTLYNAAKVKEFLALVEVLTPVEDKVSLDSESAITAAESSYRYMPEGAKSAEGVAEAYAILQQARAKYDELFAVAEAERVQVFIDAANKVPTDIENLDILWNDVLEAASNAFYALAYDTQQSLKTDAAYTRWYEAQRVFDKQGYQKITMVDPNVLFSGHATNPSIVLQIENNMINSLFEFYGVTSLAELDGQAIIWLNVYVDGEYMGRGAIPATALGHDVAATYVQNVLKALSSENDKVVSGGSFGFTLNVADKNDKYIPSNQTKLSASKIYTW